MTATRLQPLLDSWELALEAENKAPRTIGNYLEGLNLFARWLLAEHGDLDVDEITPGICRSRLGVLVETRRPSTARTRWAAMRQL